VTRDQDGLRIEARQQRTVTVHSCEPLKSVLPAEGTLFTYRAQVQTNDLKGKAYLEIGCNFADGPNEGEYSNRNLEFPISGTNEWASCETSFPVPNDKWPDQFKLNVVIEGKGKVWIKDIKLLRGPLPK
jgi:hypothetical protein